MLPQSYQDSCYLSADSSAVQQYTSHSQESTPADVDHQSSNETEVDDFNDACLPSIPKRQVQHIYIYVWEDQNKNCFYKSDTEHNCSIEQHFDRPTVPYQIHVVIELPGLFSG